MSNLKAPKIVVAVALAAVYGTGLAMVTLRHAPESRAAQAAAAAPTTQVVEQPAVMTEAPAPVANAAENKLEAAARDSESAKPEAPGKEMTIARKREVASVATGSPAETSDVEKPGSAAAAASAGSETASSTVDAPSSAQVESESDGNDSQIAAGVGT